MLLRTADDFMVFTPEQAVKLIRKKALEIGFDDVGFTADLDPTYKDYFIDWIKKGLYADMKWMEISHLARLNPKKILASAKSCIVTLSSYHHNQGVEKQFKQARYSYGTDYHDWIKTRLESLADFIHQDVQPNLEWRSFVDTGPIFEKDLAAKAGLGWIGKNTCLINPRYGSFVFLGVILSNLELPESRVSADRCGSCKKCINSCPTKALTEFCLNPQLCLAYQTIEKKGERNPQLCRGNLKSIIGCDICQDVCPWNKGVPVTKNQSWLDSFEKYQLVSLEEMLLLTPETYHSKFQGSCFAHVAYADVMRNVFLVIANLNKKDLMSFVVEWRQKNPLLKLSECEWCLTVLQL